MALKEERVDLWAFCQNMILRRRTREKRGLKYGSKRRGGKEEEGGGFMLRCSREWEEVREGEGRRGAELRRERGH